MIVDLSATSLLRLEVADLGERHLLHPEEVVRVAGRLRVEPVQRVRRHRLVAQVQLGQLAAGLDERPRVLDQRDARQHLLQVGRVGLAVLRGVQQPVDVEEDVVLGDRAPYAAANRFSASSVMLSIRR